MGQALQVVSSFVLKPQKTLDPDYMLIDVQNIKKEKESSDLMCIENSDLLNESSVLNSNNSNQSNNFCETPISNSSSVNFDQPSESVTCSKFKFVFYL